MLSRDDAAPGLRSSSAAAHESKHDAADPALGKAADEVVKNTICVAAQCADKAAKALVVREGNPPLPLVRPQLGESKLEKRKPAATARVARDLLDQPLLVVDVTRSSRFFDNTRQFIWAHRR